VKEIEEQRKRFFAVALNVETLNTDHRTSMMAFQVIGGSETVKQLTAKPILPLFFFKIFIKNNFCYRAIFIKKSYKKFLFTFVYILTANGLVFFFWYGSRVIVLSNSIKPMVAKS